MAANLLEFVMSLAHNPEAAEAYAENPLQVLQNADLGDVSPADIDALLPMASGATVGAGPDTSVWRGSDALHAFDSPSFDVPGSFESSPTFDTAGLDGPGTVTNGEPLFGEVPATTLTVPVDGTDGPDIAEGLDPDAHDSDAFDHSASLDGGAMNGHSVGPAVENGSFFDDAPSPHATQPAVPDTDLPASDSWDDI